MSLSFFDQVFGFFTGIRQRGIQTTEEILRDGNIITAIGQIELDGSDLKLQESSVGPMFLTTATKSLLIRRFEQARNGMLYVFCIEVDSPPLENIQIFQLENFNLFELITFLFGFRSKCQIQSYSLRNNCTDHHGIDYQKNLLAKKA